MSLKWINIYNELPPEGIEILGYFPNHGFNVVITNKGITEKERQILINKKDPRGYTYYNSDVFGNNLVPYSFHWAHGPGVYFGQEIACWAKLEIPKGYENLSYTFNGNTEEGVKL